MTVVETRRFLDDVERMFSEEERAEFVFHLATHPEQGEVVPGSGGVRKIRWSRAGMGKRGGARVIYYFHNGRMPIFLLAAYAKNEKADLSAEERKTIRQRIPLLVKSYFGGKDGD
jgi:hypothetical protein